MYNSLIEQQYFIIDFDSTFVSVEALDELANIALTNNPHKETILKQIREITRQGMEGTISFPQSLKKRLALFKANKSHINKLILFLQKHITPSIQRNKPFFQQYADLIYIISGGFEEYIYPIAKEFGIEKSHILANKFIFDKTNNVVGYEEKNPLAQKGGKIRAVNALGLQGDIIVIGDGYTDYEIKQQGIAKRFYAFTENVHRSVIASKANEVLFSFDEFLYMYNFPRLISYPKSKIRVLLLENINPKAIEFFQDEGYNIETIDETVSEDILCERIEDISILGVDSTTKINENILNHAKKMLAIGRFGLGTGNIDKEYAAQKGIAVFNAPHSNTRSVAELVLGMIIILSRRIIEKDAEMQKGIWNKIVSGSHEIRAKKLGIIGYDAVGSQVSVLAELLGMDVLFYDTSEKVSLGNAKQVDSLEELLRLADVITLHLEANDEIQLDEHEFSLMRHGVLFLNLSRGYEINPLLLKKFIKNGTIAGAAIDVFANKPKTKNQIFTSLLQGIPNVILTPHIGGSTEESQQNAGEFVAEKIVSFINTGNSLNSVNFPNIQLPKLIDAHRLVHVHKNVPGVLAGINGILAKNKINIEGQYLKTNEYIGYVITDIKKNYSKEVLDELKAMPETIRLRVLY